MANTKPNQDYEAVYLTVLNDPVTIPLPSTSPAKSPPKVLPPPLPIRKTSNNLKKYHSLSITLLSSITGVLFVSCVVFLALYIIENKKHKNADIEKYIGNIYFNNGKLKCKKGINGNAINCTDVDECLSNPCHLDATCVNSVGSYSCECQDGFRGNGTYCTPIAKSCAELYRSGIVRNGIYTIKPDKLEPFKVTCDMTTDGGGWTIVQRRLDGSVDFYRNWKDYKNGFGDLNGEFWLGLDDINRLTRTGQNVLRIDLSSENETRYAIYSNFELLNETEKYKLTVGAYSGDAGNSLDYHSGMKFTTKDNDNDEDRDRNCAVSFKGGWWYNACHSSNLNGLYHSNYQALLNDGVIWRSWKGLSYSLKKAEMKIRPSQF